MKKNNKNRKTCQRANSNKWIFYTIAAFIPMAFFVLLELGLRGIGFGQDVPLFIENPAHPSYHLPRPDVMSRYFPENAAKPSVTMEANFILKDKPKNAYRIIIQGGSTAAGFPYGLGASIAGTIDQRLKPSLPGRYVEVLNTAMSAVNSYTLLDFADEIIEQQPDAVFIYAGHNEFLGILGVGSNFTAMGSGTTTRWFLSLKNYRIFQLLQTVYFGLAQSQESVSNSKQDASKALSNEQAGQQSRTFMAKVAKDKAIPKGSAVYNAGIAQFENNMSALLAKYEDAGIQVYLSTIASNHADQAPFSSLPIEDKFQTTASALFDADLIGVGLIGAGSVEAGSVEAGSVEGGLVDNASLVKAALEKSSLTKQSQRSHAQMLKELQTASSVLSGSQSADLHFKIATLALKLQQPSIAKSHFALAIEHDQLRFRAPMAINEVIRKLATQYNAVLVDAQKELAMRSPNGIVGRSMMLEHLHPNLQGYFVISNAFYDALARNINVKPFANVGIQRAWSERLILPQEEYYGFATILNLTADYPFTKEPRTPLLPKPADWQQQLGQDFFVKKITWLQMMETSLNRYKLENNQIMMAKTTQILADALPHNGLYNLQIAEIKFKKKRLNESLYYYRRAKLAGALGKAIDNNIQLIEEALQRSAL